MARIVHVFPRYAPARGGAELFFVKISEALAAHGHDVSVWTTDTLAVPGFTAPTGSRLPRDEEINGVRVRRFPIRYLPAQRYLRTAAHWLPFGTRWKSDTLRWTPWVPSLTHAASTTREPVSIVHASSLPYSSFLYAGVALAAATRSRLIMSPFTHVAPPGAAGAVMRRAYLSPLNVGLMSRADRVFVQTAYERDALQKAGVSTTKTIVGLGVDPRECSGGDRGRARRQWQVADDEVIVGHLANKSWDKGTVDLIDAAERLWDAGVPFRLVLAGPEMRSFQERWSRVRHSNRIVRLGELSDDERKDLFAAVDVYALPSYVESFGLSPLEAGLNGAAVVAYDHGGPGQIFRHEETALLAAVGNVEALARHLERLVRDSSERRRLGQGAAGVATSYSWQRVIDLVIAEYESLMA
jgi:glycosyltransferase involved in cell wall biosynthesis